MKKLLLLASAAVFVYAAFTRFRPGADADDVQMSVPVRMDKPISMVVTGGAYAYNISDTYYDCYMRSLIDVQFYVPEQAAQ